MRRNKGYGFLVLILLIIIAIVIGTVAWQGILHSSRVEKIVTVERIWIKGAGDNVQKYLFSDTEGTVYQITDEIGLMVFDASNRWARTHEGKTYRIIFYGWRNQLFSWYQNAIEIEEIDNP